MVAPDPRSHKGHEVGCAHQVFILASGPMPEESVARDGSRSVAKGRSDAARIGNACGVRQDRCMGAESEMISTRKPHQVAG